MTRTRVLLLSITLPLAVFAWPLLLLSCLIPLFGFLALPTVLSLSLYILYGATWLLYLVLAPGTPLPYSPRRCYKVILALSRYLREAWHTSLLGIAIDWSYRRVLVLGAKGRESILQENVSYGSTSAENRLDVYLPLKRRGPTAAGTSSSDEASRAPGTSDDEQGTAESSRPKVPVVVLIPGGGWSSAFSDKRYYLQVALTLRKKGLMVVVPNITLYPQGTVLDMVEDIRKVLHWTGENAARLGGEPSAIYLMGHGSGSHLSLLTVVQEAVVRSRDAYWLSSYTKTQKQEQQNGYSSSEGMSEDGGSSDEGLDSRLTGDSRTELHHHSVAGQGEIEISAGIRRLEIFGGEAVQVPRIKGMILMAGVGDVIKHVRMEAKNGLEQISPLRRALGPSHASCLMASPSHLLFGAKQIIDTEFLPRNFLLVHGGMDRSVPIIQTVLIRTLLQGIGVSNVSLKAYKDLTHMECITALCGPKTSKYSSMLANEIVGFVANAEKQGRKLQQNERRGRRE